MITPVTDDELHKMDNLINIPDQGQLCYRGTKEELIKEFTARLDELPEGEEYSAAFFCFSWPTKLS